MDNIDPKTDSRAFRDALGSYATGVTIITTGSADGPVGITANSFASVSLDPPLVLWMPAKSSRRFGYFEQATHYAIHVLASDQEGICSGFSRDKHAFDGLEWEADARGVPHIHGCLARFECERRDVHDAGDHVIIVGEVLRASTQPGVPLLFQNGRLSTSLS